MVPLGRRLGALSAEEAAELDARRGVSVAAGGRGREAGGGEDIREVLEGVRPSGRPKGHVRCGPRRVDVLGEYDVVVVGGGTSGAAAAIGAARRGARVLVAEFQGGLGGVGTVGMIGKPYHGRRAGFSAEVPFPGDGFTMADKMAWYHRQVVEAGGEVWYGVIGCGVVLEGDAVRGAVMATPSGRGAVLAKVVIDGTGNADLAVAAGAESMYGTVERGDIALQGTGLPPRPLGTEHCNTDYLLVDESDMVDVHRALVGARMSMPPGVFDAGSLIQTRERRRVVGDHVMTHLDQIAGRTYADSIVRSASDYDSHGYPSNPYFALIPHDAKSRRANHPAPGGACYTSYRCLLPRGIEGMLVTGLGISMRRDAAAMVRMQLDLANQGYAAGVAAAMAASRGVGLRRIDVRALQRHLVEIGSLPAEALTHEDSFPLPAAAVGRAVAELGETATGSREAVSRALAVVLSHPRRSLPALRRAWRGAEGEARLRYAKVLGVLGDRAPVPELAAALDATDRWDGKIYQGRMAEYAHLPTPVDALVLALGRTRDERALPPILRKLELLDAKVTLSHHRAVALALEAIGDARAAAPLAALLAKPGMGGHAMTELEPLHDRKRSRRRTGPLREVVLARALFRCGDHRGLARRILETYTRDVRGLFARHAHAVLAEGE
jgi:hypothetical protein